MKNTTQNAQFLKNAFTSKLRSQWTSHMTASPAPA